MSSYLCELNEFSVIKLTGSDNRSFLQGQVTCDVTKFEENQWSPGCHCNAKGKMWSSFLAYQQDQDIYLLLTKESAASTLSELNKYGVFAKVDITDDSENWFIYGSDSPVEGQASTELTESHFLILSNIKLESNGKKQDWWQKEILSGRAHLHSALVGEYVPQMLNLQALDYISFNKGCYMGQEMVARMRYLGKNKRALYIAETDLELDAKVGDEIAININGNFKNVGKVVLSAINNNKAYFQLVLPKDTELSESVYLKSKHKLTLLKLPYELEQ